MLRRWLDSLSKRRIAFVLAGVSGVLYFTGFCGLDQFYLSWICLVPVLWALDDPTLSFKESLAISWFFGLVTHMGGYTWIVGMLRDFAYLPLPLALMGYVLLCAGQGTLLAAFGVGIHRLRVHFELPFLWTAPAVMVLCEWLWPALFPSYLSNSQYLWITAIQSVDIWGPLGLTFLLTLCSSVIYQTLAARFRQRGKIPWVGWGVFGGVFVANLVYGFGAAANIDDTVAHAEGDRIKIGIVQVSMGIYEKTKNPREGLRRYREQSLEVERQGADLILWPESGYYFPIATGTKNVARQVLGPITKPMMFGGLRTDHDGTRRLLYNTAWAVDGDGEVLGTYDKTYLLAFGEYLPFGDWLPFLYELSPHTSRFERGAHTDSLEIDGIKYGVLICYEDILPGFVRKVMEQEPDVLINLTNDSWFGKTREPTIHLALSVFRAVEHRRFLVRSTNTGISAYVDPAGRILDPTPIFARANRVREVVALSGTTFYGRVGDWIAWLALAAVLFWIRKPFLVRLRPP